MREGFTRKDDSVPDRCFDEPVPSGPKKGSRLSRDQFAQALERFYEISGWDKATGSPLRSKLKLMGIERGSRTRR